MTDNKELYETIDFGIIAGIGYRFKVSEKLNIGIEVKGSAGLIEIYTDTKTNAISALSGLNYRLN